MSAAPISTAPVTAGRTRRLWKRLARQLSTGGILAGLILFSLSLTPSLLPRTFVLQGVLGGCCFAAGYGIGVFLEWLWTYFELSIPHEKIARAIKVLLMLASIGLALVALWLSTSWQNSIREVMGIAPVETRQPVWVALIALVPAGVLIGIGTLIVAGVRLVWRWLARITPRRVAFVGSVLLVGALTGLVVDGILVRSALHAADRFYADLDALAGLYEEAPTDPLHSGGPGSLIAWDTIGQDARVYVQSGPTAEEISALTGKPAQEPVRVYVGLRSAPSVEERVHLAFDEMIRVGAFDKSILVLIMPVGTGWVDPPAIDTLEILHGGDVASVAVQYSYLTSWLSLVVEPEVGTETSKALFNKVYAYWTTLPHDHRPRLYLHGLSLGAYASQSAATLYSILADPFQGALWAGPPFASPQWRNAVLERQPGSPEWLPRFGDDTIVRFTNQHDEVAIPGAKWGPMRLVYLQYPSDPVVFFDPAVLYRPPEWLEGQRPPDISPLLNWYPVVTFLQLALDMALAQTSPIGFGHVYAPQDYFDAWVAVTDPPGWTKAELADLRARLTRRGGLEAILAGWFRKDQDADLPDLNPFAMPTMR